MPARDSPPFNTFNNTITNWDDLLMLSNSQWWWYKHLTDQTTNLKFTGFWCCSDTLSSEILMKKELKIVTNALLSGRKDPIFIFIRFSFTASALYVCWNLILLIIYSLVGCMTMMCVILNINCRFGTRVRDQQLKLYLTRTWAIICFFRKTFCNNFVENGKGKTLSDKSMKD